jgi:hypothetical protein
MNSKKHPPIFDVFQPGLRRGSERLPYDPAKAYAYVEHPIEGWRVYLRSAVFIHEDGVPFNPMRFIAVKKTGTRHSSATWEPPKGQMEGKDMRKKSTSSREKSVMELLTENVRRETEEESHITRFKKITYTGLAFQAVEPDFPPNTFFQYHIFQGFVDNSEIGKAFEVFDWIKEHPDAFARWRRDRREKDEIDWFNPRKTRLNPRWCPAIFALYLKEYTKK